MQKKWYKSKTIWVNGILLVASVAQAVTGHEVVTTEMQTVVLGVVNLVLRVITKEEISW